MLRLQYPLAEKNGPPHGPPLPQNKRDLRASLSLPAGFRLSLGGGGEEERPEDAEGDRGKQQQQQQQQQQQEKETARQISF